MKEQTRILPTVEILPGMNFYVDAITLELIDTKNSSNRINALEMLFVDDHFEFVFDKQTRNLKLDNWLDRDNPRYEYCWLRPLAVIDTEGAKILYALNKDHFPSNLPVVDLDGVKFLYDRTGNTFFLQVNPYNQIKKSALDIEDKKWGFFFDRIQKVVPFPHEIECLKAKGKLPEHIRFIPIEEINYKIKQAETPAPPNPSQKRGRRL